DVPINWSTEQSGKPGEEFAGRVKTKPGTINDATSDATMGAITLNERDFGADVSTQITCKIPGAGQQHHMNI
ncbi:MAG: hypothetical protein K2Y39_19065, partial [Candidatus Obscuribacterales bacterium]|nr:hypothetical protein [Candidatus Obscuribacterales bacterium]